MSASGSRSARTASSKGGRHNKLYRAPRTPPPEECIEKEKGFTLDSIAVSSISCDYSQVNPKVGPVVPPYNGQKDRHPEGYYKFYGVAKTLEKTGQLENGGCSIEGPVLDRYHAQGAGHVYLANRNQFGAGHSRESVDGHSQFMAGIKPVTGYHGPYGFRRNTPWLRMQPSPFGTASRSPTH